MRVVFLVRRPAGGLGDRYVGLVTAVQLARALRRDLKIRWEDGDGSGILEFDTSGPIEGGIHLPAQDRQMQEREWWSTRDIAAELDNNPSILLQCNVALGQYLWRNPHYAGWLGVYNPVKDYRTAFHDVLRPSQQVRNLADKTVLGRNITWGIQIRMGETYMPGSYAGYVQVNPDKLQTMLTEARALIPSGAGVFITSDSPLAWEAAQDILEKHCRLTYFNKPITHIDKGKRDKEGLMKAIVDIHVLARLPNLIITTASNFGRVPAIVADAELWGWTGYKVEPINRRDMLSKKEVL